MTGSAIKHQLCWGFVGQLMVLVCKNVENEYMSNKSHNILEFNGKQIVHM